MWCVCVFCVDVAQIAVVVKTRRADGRREQTDRQTDRRISKSRVGLVGHAYIGEVVHQSPFLTSCRHSQQEAPAKQPRKGSHLDNGAPRWRTCAQDLWEYDCQPWT